MTTPPANAIPLGGQWPSPNYTYFKNLGGFSAGYDTPVTNAAGAWNSGTMFTISQAPPSSAQVSLTVDTYGATDWIGIGIPGPNSFSGTYTYGSIQLNASWMNNGHWNCANPGGSNCVYGADDSSKKRCVAAHEMGHVIGLAHTVQSSDKIMNEFHGARCHTKGLTGPTANDAADVNDIY